MATATRVREARVARHRRVRRTIFGTPERPRLAVYRSLTHIYAQVIDDSSGKTLVSASSLELRGTKTKKSQAAREVGSKIGERTKATGIENVVFDRGGFLYHGRVKALADAARAAGLKF